MKPFTTIAIRDLATDYPFRWRDSYFLEPQETLEGAIEAAQTHRKERGGKYGFVIYENGAEVGCIHFGSVGNFVERSKY